MATGTAGTTARLFPTQQIHYLRKDITYADAGDTVTVGVLPAGALILKAISGVHVSTAFSGGSAYTLDVGYSTDSGTNNLGTLLTLAAVGFVILDETVTDMYLTADRTIQALVTSDGTAGVAQIIIAYIPNQ